MHKSTLEKELIRTQRLLKSAFKQCRLTSYIERNKGADVHTLALNQTNRFSRQEQSLTDKLKGIV